MEQQRAVAEEALRLDEERREREDNGEEVDMAELRKTANGEPMKGEGTKTGEEKKVVARTRVSVMSPSIDLQDGSELTLSSNSNLMK